MGRGVRARWSTFAGLAAALLATSSSLAAERASARLTYQRAATASDCPDDEALRDAVRARLGYDPFAEGGELSLAASIERSGKELRARLVLSLEGAPSGERELLSERAECSELGQALALAIALAIDPLAQPVPAPPAPPAPVDKPAVRILIQPAPKEPQPPVPAPKWPKSFLAQLSVRGALGAQPGPTAGLAVGVGLRVAAVSVSLEGSTDLPTYQGVAGGSVGGAISAGSLVPCYHLGPLGICVTAAFGALRSEGQHLPDAQRATTFWAAVGARAAVEVPADGLLAFRAHLGLQVPLVRNTFTVGELRAWTSSPVSGDLALGIRLRL